MTTPPLGTSHDELIRRLAMILGLAAIAAVSVWIMAPFLPAILWAGTIAVATWPLLLRLQATLGGRRWAAVTLLTLLLAVCFFIPLLLLVGTIAHHAGDAADIATDLSTNGLPAPPAWVATIPLAGRRIAAEWTALSSMDVTAVRERLEPALKVATQWLLGSAGSLLRLVFQVLLTMVITALMYSNGEKIVVGLRAFFRRIGGEGAEALLPLAASSARGVALGVVVTAVLQAFLTGVALALAGVPGAALLGGLALVFCLAQLGPLFILAAAVAWLYWSHQTTAATVLLVASIGLVSMDNILRPILITRGAKLPLLLVFVGVIGGMITLGLIGIFIGPVMLAVGWTLLQAWVGRVSVADASVSAG
jgi:predicted PurR-regulated permease PerM